jgi:hypothetical protein
VPYRLFYKLGSADELYPAPLESRLVPPSAPTPPPAGKPEEQSLDPGKEDAQ